MKKVIIVHCWEGHPNYCWYPNTKEELEKRGYKVVVPEMPETDMPKFNKWLQRLREVVGEPNESVYLIGHSLGCITILKYLESLKENEKIGGAILVAGFTGDLGYEEIKSFIEAPISFEKIKTHCQKFVAIHSDNDPYVSLKYGNIFKKELNAKLIIKHNMGHFSSKPNCTQLPEVVENLSEIAT